MTTGYMPPQISEMGLGASPSSSTNDDNRHQGRGRKKTLKARSSDLDFQVLEIEHSTGDNNSSRNPQSAHHFFSSQGWYLFLLFFSAMMYSVMGCGVKLAITQQDDLSSTEIVLFRAIFQFSIVLGAMCFLTPNNDDDEHDSKKAHGSCDDVSNGEYNPVPTMEKETEEDIGDNDDDNDTETPNDKIFGNDRIRMQSDEPAQCHREDESKTSNDRRRQLDRPLICYNPFGPPNLYKIVIVRGFVGGFGFCLYYFTISALPLGDAVTILSLNPVVTVVLASVFLQEDATVSKIIAASCSAIGALLMARPSFLFGASTEEEFEEEANSLGYISGLLGACCGATVYILIRKAGKKGVHTLNMLFSWCVFGLTISATILLFSSATFVVPSSATVCLYILLACCSGTVAHFLLNYAARKTPAGIASIIRSSGILWSYILEVMVFGQVPSKLTITGVVLIVTSLAVVAMDKNRSNA